MCAFSGHRFPDRLCCLFTPVSLGKTLPAGFSFLVEQWGDNPGLTFLGGHGGQSLEEPADCWSGSLPGHGGRRRVDRAGLKLRFRAGQCGCPQTSSTR